MGKEQIFAETENFFKERVMKIFFKIENSHLLSIIKRGLTMLVPVIVVGALAVSYSIEQGEAIDKMFFYAIPFICVPILALILSYGAVAFGIISPVCNEITWTMPVIVSGYVASGSIAGV